MRLIVLFFVNLFVGSICIAQTTNVFPPNGNAGIGTNSPSTKLEVIGGIKADSIIFPDGTIQYTARTDSFQSLKIGQNSLLLGGSGLIRDDDDLYIQSDGSILIFDEECPVCPPTPITTIYNTLINANNVGKVGIGILNPTEKLTVGGTIESTTGGFKFPDGTVQSTAASNGGSPFTDLDVLNRLTVGGQIETSRIVPSAGDSIIHISDSSIMIYANANTIWHTPTGNVLGIQGLTIQAFPQFSNLNTFPFAFGPRSTAIGHNVSTSSKASEAIVLGSGISNVSGSTVLTNDEARSLMVGFNSDIPTFYVGESSGLGTTGDVGIGTSSPDNKLTVDGDADFTSMVGIGTPTPSSALHVAGGKSVFGLDNVTLSLGLLSTTGVQIHQETAGLPPPNGEVALLLGDTTARSMLFAPHLGPAYYNGLTQNGDIGIIYRNGKNNIGRSGFVIVPQGGSEGIRINPTGNVGIGTPLTLNPNNYKLAVNGIIGCKDLWVENTSTAWPDFVFDEGYNLRTLPELSEYIQANHRLPGFDSESEIEEKKGVSVAETQYAQQITLEEYAKYLIALDKRTADLEKQSEIKDQLIQDQSEKIKKLEKIISERN